MNAPAKRPRKKHEPVDARLLATAGRCFIREGFGYGIDDILREADVAKMSLYTNFQSKYGLMERLLDLSKIQWINEVERISANPLPRRRQDILGLVQTICAASRDPDRRTGLISQALIEFPRTGKNDELHKKKDAIHAKAHQLQQDLFKALEQLCRDADIPDPKTLAQQLFLVINGYFIMEPMVGKPDALARAMEVTQTLVRAASAGPEIARAAGRASPLQEAKKFGKVTRERQAEIKKEFPNADGTWTNEANIEFTKRAAAGASDAELSRVFKRSPNAIKMHRKLLVQRSAAEA